MEHEFEQEFRMLGLKIAYYRKVKNLTQEQLAEKLGTSTSYIGSIESRTYKPDFADHAVSDCKGFGCSGK